MQRPKFTRAQREYIAQALKSGRAYVYEHTESDQEEETALWAIDRTIEMVASYLVGTAQSHDPQQFMDSADHELRYRKSVAS